MKIYAFVCATIIFICSQLSEVVLSNKLTFNIRVAPSPHPMKSKNVCVIMCVKELASG